MLVGHKHNTEMGNGHAVGVDRIVRFGQWPRPGNVKYQLMTIKIKVDPIVAGPAEAATKYLAVEALGFFQLGRGEGEVERSNTH